MLFGGGGEDLGTDGLGHFGGKLLDEFLEEGRKVGVGALELILGVREKRFEVVVGGGDTVYEIFEDEGESI